MVHIERNRGEMSPYRSYCSTATPARKEVKPQESALRLGAIS